jgi:3-dehydroquinate dehydratase-2
VSVVSVVSVVSEPAVEARPATIWAIWVINGPNLNLLGTREPDIYGRATLAEIERELVLHGERLGAQVECFQSNDEGALVTRIQAARGVALGLILNPGAYAHTSIAIRDALSAVALPAIEVHLSNVHAREPFRHTLMTAGACVGVIAGLGATGYHLALEALIARVAGHAHFAGPSRAHPSSASSPPITSEKAHP